MLKEWAAVGDFKGGNDAHTLVRRGVESARRKAVVEIGAAVTCAREAGHRIVSCAVLTADPLPDWTIDEILAVHFRMHKAEGVLFRDALARAAAGCGLSVVEIPEKRLAEHAVRALMTPLDKLLRTVATLGKSVGPPWGRDQKDAALAAMIALRDRSR